MWVDSAQNFKLASETSLTRQWIGHYKLMQSSQRFLKPTEVNFLIIVGVQKVMRYYCLIQWST